MSLKNSIVSWKRSNFYTAPCASGLVCAHRSLLCQTKDEELNITLSSTFTSNIQEIKMYRVHRNDGLKEKTMVAIQDDLFGRLNLFERGKRITPRKTIDKTAISRRMCVAIWITKVSPRIFVFKRMDYSTVFTMVIEEKNRQNRKGRLATNGNYVATCWFVS